MLVGEPMHLVGQPMGGCSALTPLGNGIRLRQTRGSGSPSHAAHVIDYLGTHQHLAVDLDLVAEPDGSLTIRSGAQRFYEGPIAFRFPDVLTGQAVLHERFGDASGRFAIDVRVSNKRLGDLCGYRETFTCDYPSTASTGVPASAKPRRDEIRE